jgi:hypothetical protein
MNAPEAILCRLRFASDAQAVPLAVEFLKVMADMPPGGKRNKSVGRDIEDLPAHENFWPAARRLAESLQTELPPDFPDDMTRLLRLFCDHCAARSDRLASLASMVTPAEMRHVLLWPQGGMRQVQRELTRCIKELGLESRSEFALPDQISEKDVHCAIHNLKLFIDNAQFSADRPDYQELYDKLEALAGVLDDICCEASPKNAPESACHGYCYCRMCWRLVPERLARMYGSFCDEHDRHSMTSTNYKKSLEVVKRLDTWKTGFLNAPAIVVLERLAKVWKPSYGALDAKTWSEVFINGNYEDLLASNPASVTYDLDLIWTYLPHVYVYITAHGGDTRSPTSIVDILDPHMAAENEVERQQRDALHRVFAQNFFYFQRELAHAEAWLECHEAKFGGRRHGGPRRNSGGRRPGAGRPRKKQGTQA